MEFEATPKRARATGENSAVVGEPDRLSALPDCLLHDIMSFMKARQVVQMCVLSTRWRHLWRSVPCLDLDLDEFKMVDRDRDYEGDEFKVVDQDSDDESNDDDDEDDKDWEDFEYFAVNLLTRRNIALLDSFRLNVNAGTAHSPGSRRAATWLRRAMKYRAPDPGIHREGLSSSSWRLKKLELCNVQLDSRFTKHVSSVCHSLEDLKLENCTCKHFAITSHSLKNLALNNSRGFILLDITSSTLKNLFICGGSNTYNNPLVITIPSVAYLHLDVFLEVFYGGIAINEMTSLYKASINLRGSVLSCRLIDNQFELLRSVSNVTHLKLSNWKMMVLSEESKKFVQFKNLRSLLLHNCALIDDFRTFTLFLENSPNLEKLTLQHCKFKFSDDTERKKGTSRCHSLEVLCPNLKLTEIIYNADDVRHLVELLLHISGMLPKNLLKLTKVY